MNEALIVDYDPFAMESRVSIIRDGHRESVRVCSDINKLIDELIILAYSNDIYTIKTNGPFAVTGEISRVIKENEKNQYSQNKITVEGI